MLDRFKRFSGGKTPRVYEHPVYGRFEAEAEEQCWVTRIQQDGLSLSLSILGSLSQPDASRLEIVTRTLARFASFQAAALDFIVREQRGR